MQELARDPDGPSTRSAGRIAAVARHVRRSAAREEVVVVAGSAPVARAARVGAVRGELGEIAGCSRAEAAQPPGEPVVGQRDGGDAGRGSGSASRSQRSFVAVKDATGREPVRSHDVGELLGQLRGGVGGAGVVPEQGVADDVARRIQHHHAVLLAADRDRRDVVEPAGVRDRRLQRVPPGGGGHLGAVGV